jgi:hypothetical protein
MVESLEAAASIYTLNPPNAVPHLSIHTVSYLYFRTNPQFVQYLFFKQGRRRNILPKYPPNSPYRGCGAHYL